MKNYSRHTRSGFRFIIWGVIVFSLLMISIGGADVAFGLGWGFAPKDIIMAVVVLMGAMGVNAIGTKIFDRFTTS